MEKILDIITHKMQAAFEAAGYDRSYGRVTVSNRPDLCEYQCNGALAAAKQYHCAPIQIAKTVVDQLNAQDYSLVEAVNPGFINLKLSGHFLIWRKCAQPPSSAWTSLERAKPLWWITAEPTWQSPCTSATCGPPSSARA